MGHLAVVCRSSLAICEVLQNDQLGEDDCFVGGVRHKLTSTDQGWHIKLKVGSQELTWCIDPGAQVSVMPDHIFKSTFGTLHTSDHQLLGPKDQRIEVKGFVFMKLTHRQTCIQEKVYIVKSSKLLLGMPAIQKLGLIRDIPGATRQAESRGKQRPASS